MGFLDNSTNNIILDAVLTDYGRQALAKNDGSFSITQFALGDDEVNYGIITKYGITVGKEKIEKNTPVFEAQTNANYALKNRLISLSNPNLNYIPILSLVGNVTTVSLKSTNDAAKNTSNITIQQVASGVNQSIDAELTDDYFIINMPDLFLRISGAVPQSIDSYKRATYFVPRLVANVNNAITVGATCTFSVSTRAISSQYYNVYASDVNKTLINTYINVTGHKSGASLSIPVSISSI